MKKNILLIFSLLTVSLLNSSSVYAKYGELGEIRVKGVLVAETCVIRPGDEEIEVNFGTLVDKQLYSYAKSSIEPFEIHLDECDSSIDDSVKVRFMGTANSKLPGLLALDSGSLATNLGIAILDNNENLIKINTETPMYKLNNGSNVLQFKSYVQAESDAIQSRTIGLGSFTATATFTLLYD